MTWTRSFTVRAEAQALPGLRHEVEGYLKDQGVSPSVLGRAGLLISELAHNAVENAEEVAGQVEVEVGYSPLGLRIEVECAANRDLEGLSRALEDSDHLPDPDSERGRGLWLVLTLSQQLKVRRSKQGAVRVSLLLPAE